MPGHSSSRRASPRTLIWSNAVCGGCRNFWPTRTYRSLKLPWLRVFQIKAIAPADSGREWVLRRATIDGRCVSESVLTDKASSVRRPVAHLRSRLCKEQQESSSRNKRVQERYRHMEHRQSVHAKAFAWPGTGDQLDEGVARSSDPE